MHDARAIANFILDYAQSKGASVSNMLLLKIIYFAHGWMLATKGRPLIRDRIEAWKYGPVIPSVYEQFKLFKDLPITSRTTKIDRESEVIVTVIYELDEDESNFIKHIFDFYSRSSAFHLSDITHKKGSPWDKLWNSGPEGAKAGMAITNEEISAYFSSQLERRQ